MIFQAGKERWALQLASHVFVLDKTNERAKEIRLLALKALARQVGLILPDIDTCSRFYSIQFHLLLINVLFYKKCIIYVLENVRCIYLSF